MPLLMCPNCHEGMKEVMREGVLIDMCPKCHGVWLDRGELAKLIEASQESPVETARREAPQQAAPAAAPPPYPQPGYSQPPYPYRRPDDSDDDYYKYGKYHRKSKLARIFDIFD